MIGGTAYVLVNAPWLVSPSSMKKLLRFPWPLIAGNENAPAFVLAPNPPAFWAVLTGATPGVSVSNWVKFLPFRGQVEHGLLLHDRAHFSR